MTTSLERMLREIPEVVGEITGEIMPRTHASAPPAQQWESEHQPAGGIVVGIDGSQESIAALHTGAGIARRKKAALHAAIVIPEFPSYHINPRVGLNNATLDELRTKLKNMELDEIMSLVDGEHTGWTHEIVIGDTVRRLADIAENHDAEVVIVGRHRHSAIDRALGDDTTLQLVRKSSVPVLSVGSIVREFHTAVCSVDFSASSIVAARATAALLTAPATLFLAYVELPVEVRTVPTSASPQYDLTGDIVSWFRRVTDKINVPPGVVVHPCVLTGRTAAALLEYAEQVHADVISAGSHGHNAFDRILLGSVSTALVRKALCALLVAPARS